MRTSCSRSSASPVPLHGVWTRVLARARVHAWLEAGVDVNLANAVGKEVWTMHGLVCEASERASE